MYFENLIIGLVVFLMIGIFHPIVIKSEYYFGKRVCVVFLVLGIVFGSLAVHMDDNAGIVIAMLSFTCFWSVVEVLEQYERVEKGWFKAGKYHNQEKTNMETSVE